MDQLANAWAWLQGKKTYIVATASILTTIATAHSWQDAIQPILTALGAMALRNGIAKK